MFKSIHSPVKVDIINRLKTEGFSEDLEDDFMHLLDCEFRFSESSDELDKLIAEDVINLKDFAYLDKDPGESGAWIKIKTQRGIELHWARRAKKKIDYLNEINRLLRSNTDNYTSAQLGNMLSRITYLKVLQVLDASPVFVKYQRTKTQERFLTPTQYEIVDDIDFYIDAVLSTKGNPRVKLHTAWDERNRDQVFYLQSRGISRERAQLMASMERCWIAIDLVGITEDYNEELKQRIKIVHNS